MVMHEAAVFNFVVRRCCVLTMLQCKQRLHTCPLCACRCFRLCYRREITAKHVAFELKAVPHSNKINLIRSCVICKTPMPTGNRHVLCTVPQGTSRTSKEHELTYSHTPKVLNSAI